MQFVLNLPKITTKREGNIVKEKLTIDSNKTVDLTCGYATLCSAHVLAVLRGGLNYFGLKKMHTHIYKHVRITDSMNTLTPPCCPLPSSLNLFTHAVIAICLFPPFLNVKFK